MKIKDLSILSALIGIMFSVTAQAVEVVNDDFATNGTATTDASYFTSSTEDAIEFNDTSIGVVSGSSGRAIHALFPTQTLANEGDELEVSFTFTTPATVAGSGDDIKFGLFDNLGRTSAMELGQDLSYSTASPNAFFNDLPGHFVEIDVEPADPESDLQIRKSNPTDSGRLLGTNTGFTALGSSSDNGYVISASTTYTVNLTYTRTAANGITITSSFFDSALTLIDTVSVTDIAPLSFDYGMMAIAVSSGAAGSSSTAGEADNGIDLSLIKVDFLSEDPAPESEGAKVVDDNFAVDGTMTTDASYYGSSGSNAIEVNSNSIGLVTGSSGRQLHSVFDTQTLGEAGDKIEASITFVTPATVSTGSDDIKFGFFDHLERAGLDQNTTFSSSNLSADWMGLPGFYLELDVESADPETDLDIRKSDPSDSGRSLTTSTGFTSFGSGPDLGYVIAPETTYTVNFTVVRNETDGIEITSTLSEAVSGSIGSLSVTDTTPLSFNFGMLAAYASTNAFGSSNSAGVADNGIDITSVMVEFTPSTPPPASNLVVADDFATDGTAATDASYYGSSGSNAIETNSNSIGLVTGSSGRQLHSVFDTQTLGEAGDKLETSITFVTPATVSMGSDDIKFGLFDHLERAGLDQNTTFSSSNLSADWMGLPGFYLELDVESADPETDLDIRKSDPSDSGRSLTTSTGFTSFGSGSDLGYVITADTTYTVKFTVVRTAENGLDITAEFSESVSGLIGSLTVTDATPLSFNIGMMAAYASTNAFGSSNSAGEADNGVDITNFMVEFTPVTPIVDEEEEEEEDGKIVNDDFANDGTAVTDAQYYTSSSSSAIEFNANSVGVVSGSSGRAIHALFEKTTLEKDGDTLRASITFVTPETVAQFAEDIRFGFFDFLDRNNPEQLAQNTSYSSSNPNHDFSGLPGYYVELDVESASIISDIDIRVSAPSNTGRLINTTGGFNSLGNSPDISYTIDPNTEYTVYFDFERVDGDELDITANFLGREWKVRDSSPLSFDFGMLAVNSSSGAFGSVRDPGEPDNGIDITSVMIELVETSPVNDDFIANGTDATSASYFGSSASGAIEFNSDSIGLVSGGSGRQIHGLFDTISLTNAGDELEVSISYTMPATVAATNEDIKFGLFDHLGRNTADMLAQNTSFGSSSPNSDFSGLPGFYLELDIESEDPTTDLDLRRSDPSTSGRLLTTSTGFTSLPGSSGPDIGYVLAPNSINTVSFKVTRTDENGLEITADNNDDQLTVIDASPASFDFGMLAIYASTGAVGSSSSAGEADNGIDITNVSINFTPFFEVPLVELPPIVLPTGDHPDVMIFPELPEVDSGESFDPNEFPPDDSGSEPIVPSRQSVVGALSGIIGLILPDELTSAEAVAKYFSLNPALQPWENFDLSDWALDAPNADNRPVIGDGFSARTNEGDWDTVGIFPGSEPFFFTGSDGAMVFKSTVDGAKTSENTSFPRSELREMLRRGDETISTQGVSANNWALGYQPINPDIGAREGKLTATLSIDQVTSTGASSQYGRVIIGQIHASDDEPIRLYYRKLPGNTKGGIYFVSEIKDGDDLPHFNLIGDSSSSAADPVENGIELGELFSYEIINIGSVIEVIIRRGDRDGPIIAQDSVDLASTAGPDGSGYDLADEWMYFKAGAYSQNNSGNANDFDQVRFYRLENTHNNSE
jgi:hypothetical protein